MRQSEEQLILQVLQQQSANRTLAAKKLGISTRTLRYKLAKMRNKGLKIPSARKATVSEIQE